MSKRTATQRRGTIKSGSAETWERRRAATRPDAEPMEVRGHWLLCAVCARGGCKAPPPGKAVIDRLLKFMWDYPFAPLRVKADLDVIRAHFFDAYEGRKPGGLPKDFAPRRDDYLWRRKDLEVCRVLGIIPNTTVQAYHVYKCLFDRQPTLEGICRTGSPASADWPECRFARRGYYEKIASSDVKGGFGEQTRLGEKMIGRGRWAMVRPRTRAAMREAKKRSAAFILHQAKRLYIRPSHCLCILCNTHRNPERPPLNEDNLIELYRRMTAEPDIPVTLTEGCCMVCDPCNVYHAGEHLCYHGHIKSALRDLMMLERLGLKPGATLPARELYRRIYERIRGFMDICGWRDGSNTALWWAPCGTSSEVLDDARTKGVIVGRPVRFLGSRKAERARARAKG